MTHPLATLVRGARSGAPTRSRLASSGVALATAAALSFGVVAPAFAETAPATALTPDAPVVNMIPNSFAELAKKLHG